MIKEEFKNLTPEQIPAQIALYQEDERKGRTYRESVPI